MPDQPQGNGSPQEPQGSDAPKYITSEELNKAITARFQSFEKKLDKQIGDGMGAFSSKFEEMLSAKLDAFKPQEPAAPKDLDKQSIENHPEFKGMRKQIEELRAQSERANAMAESERQKVRDSQLRTRLADELVKGGIDAQRARHAVGFLVDADKRVRWGEDESVVFRDDESGELDLSTGIKSWLKSDDAKIYMPPRGVSGSGDKPVHGGPSKGTQEASMADIGTLLVKQFGAIPIG